MVSESPSSCPGVLSVACKTVKQQPPTKVSVTIATSPSLRSQETAGETIAREL